jgi:hypothetical protein
VAVIMFASTATSRATPCNDANGQSGRSGNRALDSGAIGITVTVRDQSSTGRATGSVELEDIPAAITLRDLIRTREREEVARYNAEPRDVFEGLVMPESAEPAQAGFVMGRPRRVDWELQADRAVEAFSR